jgi:hypothetical protein
VDNLGPETNYGERIGDIMTWRTRRQLLEAHEPAKDLVELWIKHPMRAENVIRIRRR